MADDDYKARARKRAAERNDSVWYKLHEGDNTFRILKTPKSKMTPEVFYEYNIHRDVGPKRKKVRCGKDLDGAGRCWLCDVQIPKLLKAKRETRASALAPSDEMICQIAVVDSEGNMKGPKIMTPSRGVATQIISNVLGGKRDYVSHTKGYNVSLNRTGTGKLDTRYGVLDRDDEQSAVPETIIAKLKPFSELKEVPVYSESTQKAAYFNQDEDADDEEDEDEDAETEEDDDEEEVAPKKKSKGAPANKGKAKAEPEEDDEDEAEDEDEESEPPVSKKKGKQQTEPVEDEDEDEADEDEEGDEPPPSKKKSKGAPAKKGKAKSEPEEDEDDDEDLDDLEDDEPDDVEEDEDDDPKPAKTKKGTPANKGKAKAEPEEDDEDEAEDEDEESEPPVSKKKSSGPPAKRKRRA